MTFGEEFRTARIRADISQKEAARMIGRGMSTINYIEAGRTVSERTLEQAHQALQQFIKIHESKVKLVN